MIYTISEYAKLEGTSRAAVYKRLKTSLRPYVVKKGRQLFLDIPEEAAPVNPVNPDLSTIQPSVNTGGGETVNPSTPTQPQEPPGVSTLSTLSTFPVNPVSTPGEAPGMAAEAPQRPSGGGAEADRANTHPQAAPASTDAQQALQEELEQMTRERDELRREAASREQLIAAKEETLRAMQAQAGDLQADVARLREDLDRERAAHQDDRQRDRETLEQALREAHARQHELSVLLLQEQNRHKPLRLLLAEKAESIFHKTKRKENENHDEDQ